VTDHGDSLAASSGTSKQRGK